MSKESKYLDFYQFLSTCILDDVSIGGGFARDVCRCSVAPKDSSSADVWRKYLRTMTSRDDLLEHFEVYYEKYLKAKAKWKDLKEFEAFEQQNMKEL